MRIAYLATATIPSRSAYSVHVLKMCDAFLQTGNEVRLVLPAYPGIPRISRALLQGYGVATGFEIKQIPWSSVKGRSTLFALRAALSARRFGARLVYGRDLKSCVFANLLGLSTVYEAHGPPPTLKWDRFLYQNMVKRRTFLGLVCISDALALVYKNDQRDVVAKIMVVHDGADEESIERREDPGPRFNVGYIGALYQGRGVPLMLKMAQRCDWASFHLVGGSDEEIASWRSKCTVPDNVEFHGHLSYTEAARYRRLCDVLLAPYERKVSVYSDKVMDSIDTSAYMSPLKVFEYMAAGKAIISSDHAVLKEVLTDGQDALLCDPDDPEQWVAALTRLRDEPALRRRLGDAAAELVRSKYSWQARARKLTGLFGTAGPNIATS